MDLAELRELLRAEDPAASRTLESVLAFESSEWVVVYRNDLESFTGNSLLAVFLRGEELERARTRAGYDVSPGDGRPGFVTSYTDGDPATEYVPVGSEDVVPLVHVRLYNGPFPKTVELAEDFRLCWDLRGSGSRRVGHRRRSRRSGRRREVGRGRPRGLEALPSSLPSGEAARSLDAVLRRSARR